MATYIHYILGVLTVLCSIGVVCSKKPLNSALFLVMTLFLVAAHFAVQQAHFLAAVQVLVYAGAIMVLVVFVIMLLGLDSDEVGNSHWLFRLSASAAVAGFLAILALVVKLGGANVFDKVIVDAGFGETKMLGEVLFTKFLFPFELISVLLLSAIIGSVVLAKEAKRGLPKGRGLKAKQTPEDIKEGV
jgi:NADH-quinone oxidoreductase subunit J